MPIGILHVIDSPLGNLLGEGKCVRVEIGEKRERVNGLRGALDVDRRSALMIIYGTAIGFEEVLLKEVEPEQHIGLESPVTGGIDVVPQAVQIVARMEVINPVIFGLLAVKPGTVWPLAVAGVLHGSPRR